MTSHGPGSEPRVTCIVPTQGRPTYLDRAIEYFRRQTHPNKAMVIVYEHDDDLPRDLSDEDDLQLIRVDPGTSIGAKRNLAVEATSSEIIAQWDDDDWYGPRRLELQLTPLLEGSADVTGLTDTTFFELSAWRFWKCRPRLHARMFVENVLGGTLVYRRSQWGGPCRYPDTSLREDADFLCAMLEHGARLQRIPSGSHYLYLRHGANTWRFRSGAFLSANDWIEVSEPLALAGDRDFYREHRSAARPSVAATSRPRPARCTSPRVTCIMPTANRETFVPRAIRYFIEQTYEARTLLILDDGHRSIEDLIPVDPRIRYFRVDPIATLGDKRNLACEQAKGEIIMHWDDDDWMAPKWIEAQVSTLLATDADVVGLSDLYFYEPIRHQAWRYTYPPGLRPWVAGATLAYRRTFWERNPFPPLAVGEDVRFLWNRSDYTLVAHDRRDLFVASIHARNTNPRMLTGSRWKFCPPEVVERLFVRAEAGPAPAGSHVETENTGR